MELFSSESENSITLRTPEFSLEDLRKGTVSYVQSQHKHQEPREDSFMLHASDGINDSQSVKIYVTIKVSLEIPFLPTHCQFKLQTEKKKRVFVFSCFSLVVFLSNYYSK